MGVLDLHKRVSQSIITNLFLYLSLYPIGSTCLHNSGKMCVYRNMKPLDHGKDLLSIHRTSVPQFPMGRHGKSHMYPCLKGFASQERNSETVKPRDSIGTAGISSHPPIQRKRERLYLVFWNVNKSSLGGRWEGLYIGMGANDSGGSKKAVFNFIIHKM